MYGLWAKCMQLSRLNWKPKHVKVKTFNQCSYATKNGNSKPNCAFRSTWLHFLACNVYHFVHHCIPVIGTHTYTYFFESWEVYGSFQNFLPQLRIITAYPGAIVNFFQQLYKNNLEFCCLIIIFSFQGNLFSSFVGKIDILLRNLNNVISDWS